MYVQNISSACEERDLWAIFGTNGGVKNIEILRGSSSPINSRMGGKTFISANITFESAHFAWEAFRQLNNYLVYGDRIR